MTDSPKVATDVVEPYVPPVVKTPTAIVWLTRPPARVEAGESFTMTVRLQQVVDIPFAIPYIPVGGRAVHLYRDGARVKTTTSSGTGTCSFSDAVGRTGTHEYFARFEGDDKFEGCDVKAELGDAEAEALRWLTRLRSRYR